MEDYKKPSGQILLLTNSPIASRQENFISETVTTNGEVEEAPLSNVGEGFLQQISRFIEQIFIVARETFMINYRESLKTRELRDYLRFYLLQLTFGNKI